MSVFFLAIPLVLSAYTHLWNVIGFPSIHIDEAHYMRRTMIVMKNLGPQDPYYQYDHPYFGQIFLAAMLSMIGYPNSLNPSAEDGTHSVEMLYLAPRVLMGILAVLDTFLVYKIADRRYNRNVALIASVIFAVMPLSWMIRRIYLDSILLPFLLSSVFLAIYKQKPESFDTEENHKKNVININTNIPILLSGILLGLAIYTKIPAFTMIPLVGYLVYKNNKSLKTLGLWIIPVILIPLMWPAYSISVGQFDEWVAGLLHQTHRVGIPVLDSLISVYQVDPFLLILGTSGILFLAIKRDFFLLLWIVPFTAFSVAIGYAQYFHVIILLPAFSIGIGVLIDGISHRITNKRILQQYLIFGSILTIGIFGLVSTSILITIDVNSVYFKIYGFIIKYLADVNNVETNSNKVTVISSHWWGYNSLWILKYIFDKEEDSLIPNVKDHFIRDPVKTDNILLIVDKPLRDVISMNPYVTITPPNQAGQAMKIQTLLNQSKKIATFIDNTTSSDNGRYPYTSLSNMILNEKRPAGRIDVWTNY